MDVLDGTKRRGRSDSRQRKYKLYLLRKEARQPVLLSMPKEIDGYIALPREELLVY